jgi:VanZ family protein
MSNFMVKKYAYIALAITYAAFIFYLSSQPYSLHYYGLGILKQLYELLQGYRVEFLAYPFYLIYRYPDKFAHMTLYTGFGLVLNPALRSINKTAEYPALASIFFGILYAVSDEIHQIFVPNRSASFYDLIADFVGLLIAQFLIILYFKVGRK